MIHSIRQYAIKLSHGALNTSWKGWAKVLGISIAVGIGLIWLSHQLENRQQRHAAAAQELYAQLQQIIDAGPVSNAENAPPEKEALSYEANIARVTHTLHTTFRQTAYAEMSALVAAQALYAYGKLQEASAQLEWAMKHGINREYRQIARLRLATLLLERQQYEAGMKLLDKPVLSAFKPLYEERRGDFLRAQNKIDQARQAYEKAYNALGAQDPAGRFIQLKIETLGAV